MTRRNDTRPKNGSADVKELANNPDFLDLVEKALDDRRAVREAKTAEERAKEILRKERELEELKKALEELKKALEESKKLNAELNELKKELEDYKKLKAELNELEVELEKLKKQFPKESESGDSNDNIGLIREMPEGALRKLLKEVLKYAEGDEKLTDIAKKCRYALGDKDALC